MDFDKNSKILLVDDFKSTRKLELNMLKEIGYENLEEAVDGDDAINKLQELDGVDLVISDWNMPNKSGYDLLVWIRGDEKYKTVPFIMATAQSEKKEMIKALKAGATSYIPKPFNKDELQSTIDKVFDNKDSSETENKKAKPVKTSSGKLILNVAHIQITDHLALGVLKHLIETEKLKPKYFELNTICMAGWNPVYQSLENKSVDAAFILAPIAMDLFHYNSTIKLILFAHRDGSICVGNNSDSNIIGSKDNLKDFFLDKTFYLPHFLSIHHMLSDMFLKQLGLTPGVSGHENVNVFFEIVPPIQMPVFMSKDPKIGGFLVAEPIGSNAISKKIAKPMFVSSEIWSNHPCCVVAMQDHIIKEHSDAVYEFTNMLVKAGEYISDNIDSSSEIGVNFLDPQKKLGLPSAVLKKVLMDPKGIKTDNLFPVLEDIDKIQRYMTNVMGLGNIIDLEKFVDTRFAEDACKNQNIKNDSIMNNIDDVVSNIINFYQSSTINNASNIEIKTPDQNLNQNLNENSNENSNENLNENLNENSNENSNENLNENSNENLNENSNESSNEKKTLELDKKAYEKELSEKFFSKGVNLLKSGNTFEALESLFTAFALDHTNTKAVNNIVVAYKKLGSNDFALKTVNRVLEIDPDNFRAKEHKKILMGNL